MKKVLAMKVLESLNEKNCPLKFELKMVKDFILGLLEFVKTFPSLLAFLNFFVFHFL